MQLRIELPLCGSETRCCYVSCGSRWYGHRPLFEDQRTKGPSGPNGIDVPKWSFATYHLRNGGSEMDATTYGLDVAKRVFQMYWVEAETGEILNLRFVRDELIRFLAK